MPDIETLEVTASDQTEQPVEQAEVEAPEETGTEETPVESTETTETVETTPQPQSRLYANKYKSAEELERAYLESNAEASRMAAENARLKHPAPAATKAEKSQYTSDQLETWKEGRIREVAQYENAAARLQAEGKFQEAHQAASQAAESARQVRLIDAELRKADIQAATQQSTSQAAERRLMSESVDLVRQYASDLVPGTPLYSKASEFLAGYAAMGLNVESPLVQAQSVAMAAQMLGLSSKKVEQTTRKELTKTINQALKSGVQAGAGKASKSASEPDFMNMSDADFIAYKAKRGWD